MNFVFVSVSGLGEEWLRFEKNVLIFYDTHLSLSFGVVFSFCLWMMCVCWIIISLSSFNDDDEDVFFHPTTNIYSEWISNNNNR